MTVNQWNRDKHNEAQLRQSIHSYPGLSWGSFVRDLVGAVVVVVEIASIIAFIIIITIAIIMLGAIVSRALVRALVLSIQMIWNNDLVGRHVKYSRTISRVLRCLVQQLALIVSR